MGLFALLGLLTVLLAALGLFVEWDNLSEFQAQPQARPFPPIPDHLRRHEGAGASLEGFERTHRVDPLYPETALSCGVQGWALVSFTVDREGKVSGAEVVESYPRGFFDHAAIESVRQWQYERQGEPSPPREPGDGTVLFRFEIAD